MKRKFKRLSCVIASVVLTTSLIGQTTFADEKAGLGQDYALADESVYQEYLSTLSDEQLREIALKESMLQEVMTQSNTTSTYLTRISLPGNFTIYQQAADTYCIPACIQSTLIYINGSAPFQWFIDGFINRDFTAIPGFINNYQSRSPYILKLNPTQDELTSTIIVDMNLEIPTFLRIRGTSTPSWYYKTSGHCILATGIYSDRSYIEMADPYGGLIEDCPKYYMKSAKTVSTYTNQLVY